MGLRILVGLSEKWECAPFKDILLEAGPPVISRIFFHFFSFLHNRATFPRRKNSSFRGSICYSSHEFVNILRLSRNAVQRGSRKGADKA